VDNRQVDFIKGHMGGNRILLLDGSQLLSERLLPQALMALDDLCLAGHQAGIFYPPERGGTIRVRVVSVCGRDFIPTCGGLTQVLSRALVETPLSQRFPAVVGDGRAHIVIEFDSLDIATEVELQDGRFACVTTDFSAFARNLLLRGFERVDLGGLHAWRSGYFFVLDADQVRTKHPEVNFEAMDDTTKDLITLLQYRFLGATGLTSWDFTLFDRQAEGHGDVRAVFPHNVRIGFLEPSCGTGSVALALTLLTSGDWRQLGQIADGWYTLRLQTGGKAVMGGPDLTTVRVERIDGGIGRVQFSNSNVQLLAHGTVTL
jgi:hypothetical protein